MMNENNNVCKLGCRSYRLVWDIMLRKSFEICWLKYLSRVNISYVKLNKYKKSMIEMFFFTFKIESWETRGRRGEVWNNLQFCWNRYTTHWSLWNTEFLMYRLPLPLLIWLRYCRSGVKSCSNNQSMNTSSNSLILGWP